MSVQSRPKRQDQDPLIDRKHGLLAYSLWLLNKKGCFERRFFDLPTGRGFLEKTNVGVLPNVVNEKWFRLRVPQIDSPENAGVLKNLWAAWQAESLVSVVLVPLVGAERPMGPVSRR